MRPKVILVTSRDDLSHKIIVPFLSYFVVGKSKKWVRLRLYF